MGEKRGRERSQPHTGTQVDEIGNGFLVITGQTVTWAETL